MEEKKLIKPAFFVDREEMNEKGLITPAVFEEKKKSPEEKMYLVLVVFNSNGSDVNECYFDFITGRTEVRSYIVCNIDELDIHESKILVEGVILENMISVYEFMKHVEIHFNDGFDIEDYNSGDNVEEETTNNILNEDEEGYVESEDNNDRYNLNFQNDEDETHNV